MFDDNDIANDDNASGEPLTLAQRELAGALRALRPASPGPANRERLVFKAGVAVGRRSVNRWRGLAAALVVGNAAWIAVALRPGATSSGPTFIVQQPTPVAPAPATSPSPLVRWSPEPRPTSSPTVSSVGYLAMQDAVLQHGLAGLQGSGNVHRPSRAPKPLTVEDLLDGSSNEFQPQHSGERL